MQTIHDKAYGHLPRPMFQSSYCVLRSQVIVLIQQILFTAESRNERPPTHAPLHEAKLKITNSSLTPNGIVALATYLQLPSLSTRIGITGNAKANNATLK